MMMFMLSPLFLLAEAAATPPAPVAREDQVVCRTYTETGSLARQKKVCRTRKEWGIQSRDSREEAEQMQNRSLNRFSQEPTA